MTFFRCKKCDNIICKTCLEACVNEFGHTCLSCMFGYVPIHNFMLENFKSKEDYILPPEKQRIDIIRIGTRIILDTREQVRMNFRQTIINLLGHEINVNTLIARNQNYTQNTRAISERVVKNAQALLGNINRIKIILLNESRMAIEVIGSRGDIYQTKLILGQNQDIILKCKCIYSEQTQHEGICYHKLVLLILYQYTVLARENLIVQSNQSLFDALLDQFRDLGFQVEIVTKRNSYAYR